MEILKYLLLFIFFASFSLKGNSQTITVLSATDRQAIPGAHIICKYQESEKPEVILSNRNGLVEIKGACTIDSPCIISISYLGFEKRTDTLTSSENKIYYLQPKNEILNEVVVTAQYAPNSPEKAVHKIKIIDNAKIEAMGAQNLRDVLSNELNVRISQDQMLGSSMSLQGISGQNIKILLDGVPVTGRLNGNIDISQINMNNVERIEIIEGPLSVNYGTDALGGTINIISKKTQEKSLSLSSNNYYESNGQYNTSGKIGFRKGKNMISLSGGRNYFDGWRSSDKAFEPEKVRIADSLRHMDWKPKEQYFGSLYLAHYFKDLKLGYTGDYFQEKVSNKGLPRLPYFETAFDDYYTTYRINNGLNLSGNLNARYHINVLLAQNHFKRVKNTYFKDLTTLEQTLTPNSGDQDTSLFNNIISRASISSTKSESNFNYEFGYDINIETSSGLRIKDGKQQIGDYAIFSSAEYQPLKSLIIRPGLRFIYNTSYKAPLVPSVNFKYSFWNADEKSKSAAIRFSYARGFRSPSLKELYFYFVDINHNISGNENLKAEQSHNFNLSGSFNSTKNNNAWRMEASFFYNYIENMISLAQETGTQYSYFNIDKFKTIGFQLQNSFTHQHIKISLGAAYIGRQNEISETHYAKKFAFTPEGQFNVFYEWYEQELTFALFYKYSGKLPGFGLNDDSEVYQTETEDYHTADASLSRQFFDKKFSFSLGAKNLFDVTTISGNAGENAHSSGSNNIAVGMGRTYFLKLDINLNSKN